MGGGTILVHCQVSSLGWDIVSLDLSRGAILERFFEDLVAQLCAPILVPLGQYGVFHGFTAAYALLTVTARLYSGHVEYLDVP